MEGERPTPFVDIAMALLFAVLSVVVLWAMRDVPPGLFEPLGPAPVPRAVAGIVLLLSLVVLVRALRQLREPAPAPPAPVFRPRPGAAAGLGAAALLYVAAMAAELVSFGLATTLFTVVAVGVLAGFGRRWLALALVLGLVMGFGLQYIFTKVFVIDLPT